MSKITETRVRALKPKDRRYTLSEGGLVVEVNTSGRITFYASYRHEGKRLKEKLGTFPTLSVKEAKAKLQEKLRKIQTEGIPGIGSAMTLNDFLREEYLPWAETNHKNPDKTRLTLTNLCGDSWLGKMKLREVTTQKLETFKAELQKERNLQPTTMTQYLATLAGAFTKATEWGHLTKSPMTLVKKPKVDTKKARLHLSEEELDALLKEVAEWREVNLRHEQKVAFGKYAPEEPRVRMPYTPYLVILALNTGMRRQELLSLQWNDLDMFRKVVIVRGYKAKSGKTREIPLSERVLDAIDEWARLSRDLDASVTDKVFDLSPRLTPAGWLEIRKRADLQHVNFHRMRHHFCTTLCLRGVPLHVVKELAGHADITTTQRYLGTDLKDKVEAVNLL